jgi:hypothetical protein
MAKGARIAAMDFSNVAADEHIPALARVPGVLCARRYRTSAGNPKYLALYHLASESDRHTGMEKGERVNPDVRACSRPDQQSAAPRLPNYVRA